MLTSIFPSRIFITADLYSIMYVLLNMEGVVLVSLTALFPQWHKHLAGNRQQNLSTV